MEELKDMYQSLGIDNKVLEYCKTIETSLKDRFDAIDKVAESIIR